MSFIFPKRIGRLSYFLHHIIFSVVTWPLARLFEDDNSAPTSFKALWLCLLAVTLIGYWLTYIVRPRCKDTGVRWGWMFLMLVPFVNVVFGLFLLFSRSKLGIEENVPELAASR